MALLNQIANMGQGFNPAQSYATGQQQANALQLQKQKILQNQLAQQQAQEQARQREQYNALVPQMLQGNQQAIQQGAAYSPEDTAKIIEMRNKMDEGKQKQFDAALDYSGGLLRSVQNAPEEQKPALYQQARQQFLQNFPNADPSMIPEQYDSNFVNMQLGAIEPLQKPSQFEQKLSAMGYIPGTPEYQQAARVLAQSGGQNINISTGETQLPTKSAILREDTLARANSARTYNEGAMTASRDAMTALPKVDRALKLLDTVGTGPLEQQKLQLKKVGKMLGFDVNPAEIGSAEELQTILGDQIMARIGQTKGAVSEKEMQLFSDYSANFGKTPEGNKRILQFQKEKMLRDVEIGKMIRKMRKENATSIDIQNAIDDYVAQNDISNVLQPPETVRETGPDMIATNPQTGERLRLNRQTNQWEPM